MLTIFFLASAAVLIGSFIRRPTVMWQRGVVVLAVIVLLAVLVAWGIELTVRSVDGAQ